MMPWPRRPYIFWNMQLVHIGTHEWLQCLWPLELLVLNGFAFVFRDWLETRGDKRTKPSVLSWPRHALKESCKPR